MERTEITETELVQALVSVGGSEWQKADKHRIYFNNLAAWYGLATTRYNTGNIASATLDGEQISNSQARRIAGELVAAKVYYDLADGKWHIGGYGSYDLPGYLDRIVRNINAAIAAQATVPA